MMYRIYWRVPGEDIGRWVTFSHKDDAENYRNGLRDCGYKCNLVEIPSPYKNEEDRK